MNEASEMTPTKYQWEDFDCNRIAGVYMLLRDGEMQYIGQSCDIVGRVDQHRAEGRIGFDSVRIIREADEKKRIDLERELIQQHNPPCNFTNTERQRQPRGKSYQDYPRSVRWYGDNYERVKILAARERRTVNDWLNLTIERLWAEHLAKANQLPPLKP